MTKLTIRDNTELKIRCNCKSVHLPNCEHAAALFLYYLNTLNDSQAQQDLRAQNKELLNREDVLEFIKPGMIYFKPTELNPLAKNKSYEQLKIKKENGAVIPFPEATELSDTIVLNLKAEKNEFKNCFFVESNIQPNDQFSSLFYPAYLIDWQSGKVSLLDTQIKKFLSSFSADKTILSKSQALSYLTSYLGSEDKKSFKLAVNDQIIRPELFIEAKPYSNIVNNPELNETYLEVGLEVDKQPIPIPNFFFLPFVNAIQFGEFVSQNESILYLQSFFSDKDHNTAKYTYTFSNKDELTTYLNVIKEKKKIYWYDDKVHSFYYIETVDLLAFFKKYYENFGIETFHYARFTGSSIRLSIPREQLKKKMVDFIKLSLDEKYSFYSRKKKIDFFKPDIEIERKNSERSWLEYSIQLTPNDLDIINKYQDLDEYQQILNSGLIVSNQTIQKIHIIKNHLDQSNEKTKKDDKHAFQIKINRCRIFELFELLEFGADILTEKEKELCHSLVNLDEVPEYDLPANIKYEPRKYQVKGYNWIRFLFEYNLGGCLADDMGLGKTFQTILFITSIIDKVDNILIVCPVSLIMNWKHEFEKFSNLEVDVYYGEGRSPDFKNKIQITSYGLMRKDFQSVFKKHQFDVLILDEVQFIKNAKSLGSVHAHSIDAKFRLSLTGTPVENHIKEYINIMELAVPGLWGKVAPTGAKLKSKVNLEYIRDCASPFILRRKKDSVLPDLPPKIEQNVFLTFDTEEKVLYNKVLEDLRTEMNSGKMGFGLVLKSILTLRKLCLWQEQLDNISTKVNYLLTSIEQIHEEGHSCLIYSQFTSYLNHIQDYFQKRNWKFSRVDGSMSMKKRSTEIEKFTKQDTRLFLISLKAGGIGLNLTQANYVFIMDPWWNPAVENQAIDRAHRIGQDKSVYISRLIIKNSIEEKVLKLQEEKKELFDNLVDIESKNFETMSLDTLRNLVLG